MLEFVKEKSYYLLGGTIVLIIMLIAISSCSSKNKSYSDIENDMVVAAKNYYKVNNDKLPKDEESIKISLNTLIDLEYIKAVVEPENKEKTCEGHVQVKKVDDKYVYTPFLKCAGSYEPEYLSEKIKNAGQDEYGNGIYLMDGEYVYRGSDVKNYVLFNDQLWRIMLVDSEGDIQLISNYSTDKDYYWENSYNIEEQANVGVNTNYHNSNIRKSLVEYYQENFSDESKAKIVPKNLCIGALSFKENFNRSKECNKIQEKEYIGLPRVSDYQRASLDPNCTNRTQGQCRNHNYLVKSAFISTWLLNPVEENTYSVFAGYGVVYLDAADKRTVNPVVFITKDTITSGGIGTKEEPFILK